MVCNRRKGQWSKGPKSEASSANGNSAPGGGVAEACRMIFALQTFSNNVLWQMSFGVWSSLPEQCFTSELTVVSLTSPLKPSEPYGLTCRRSRCLSPQSYSQDYTREAPYRNTSRCLQEAREKPGLLWSQVSRATVRHVVWQAIHISQI